MDIRVIVSLSILSLLITVVLNIVMIVLNLLTSRKLYHANSGIENVAFPSSNGFSEKDLAVDKQFCGKFRGSVRLGNLNIFTDEQIEEKRKKANIPLP